jgi:hypothetical protein
LNNLIVGPIIIWQLPIKKSQVPSYTRLGEKKKILPIIKNRLDRKSFKI